MQDYLNSANAAYIDTLFDEYQNNPEQLDPTWKSFFDGLSFCEDKPEVIHTEGELHDRLEFEVKVLKLIQSYRDFGYVIADINPLERNPRTHPLLHLGAFGLNESDFDRECRVGAYFGLGVRR